MTNSSGYQEIIFSHCSFFCLSIEKFTSDLDIDAETVGVCEAEHDSF